MIQEIPEVSGRWRPILTGERAVAALAAVQAIASDLAGEPRLPNWLTADALPTAKATLATGDPGQAIFHAYLALHSGDEASAARAVELLDRATDAVSEVPLGTSLFTGLPGLAWVTEHLRGRLFEQEDDANDEVDQAVLASLSRSPWPGDHDLIHGLAGLGVYALERLPRPAAARCPELVVERLAERAERTAGGAAWWTPPEEVLESERDAYPEGLYNLGAAHGAAGIVSLLAGICRAGVATELAGPLLEDAVRWLLARRLPKGSGFGFPHFHSPSAPPRKCRVAWCYGDLGMAATIAAAATARERPDWRSAAVSLALIAAERPFDGSGVLDAGLCHGAAGVAHLFNRLYQESGEERLGDAARRWLARTLDLREGEGGIGGYRVLNTNPRTGERTWAEDPGFLNGAAGVGLALLAAVSPVEPEWDRLLLVSHR